MAKLTEKEIAVRQEIVRLVNEIAEIDDILHSRIREFNEAGVVDLLKVYKNILQTFARDLGIILLKETRVN